MGQVRVGMGMVKMESKIRWVIHTTGQERVSDSIQDAGHATSLGYKTT